MTSSKIKSAFICLFIISFCSVGFCGKFIYPWNATTAIVKAGESFTVWFDADSVQTVDSVELHGPHNSVSIPSVTRVTGSWEYDEVSGNTYDTKITVTVPADAPVDRYDLILNTTTGQEISQSAVKIIKEYKTDYTIMHISDTHLCQGAKINGHPERLFKISGLADIANIIGPEMIFFTGDLINFTNDRFPDAQERADFFYKGYQPAGLKGVHGFNAATFSAAGNHDFLQLIQPYSGEYDVKSKFWNQYHGLQSHHFKYGNTRCMVVNDGWVDFDWGYQLVDHNSWLGDVSPGNLRVAAYHKSENGIMGAWANEIDLGLAVIGHNHHLAADNPYDLGGKNIQYYADSVREHFCFNLFRVNSDGSYTAVNNQEIVENPADAPSLWRPKLTLDYANANDGTCLTNTATLANKFSVGFPRARVRFVMPKGASYTVSKGTVEQAFDGDSVRIVDVRVAINANSMTSIEIKSSEVTKATSPKRANPRNNILDKAKPKELDNLFYCFNNGVRLLPNAPEGFDAQAALVEKIGYIGLAGQGGKNYYRWRQAMDKVGLAMPEIYIRMGIGEDGKARYDGELKNIIKHAKDRNLLIAFVLYNDLEIEDKQEADQIFIEGIRELADYCHPFNVKIAIYPHANLHCETVSHSVSLAKAINRINVGAIFNLCHFLKVEASEDWKEMLQMAGSHLFMVSINGADNGDTRSMGWDKLIQPLGQGTFDTYELVKFLKDNGYDGLFGLQCYNIKQDCEKVLTQSMSAWKSYQNRYRQERN